MVQLEFHISDALMQGVSLVYATGKNVEEWFSACGSQSSENRDIYIAIHNKSNITVME